MSSGGALVRFPDGTIKETTYHGTSDVLDDRLDESYVGFDLRWPVEIWTNYGGGFWWKGLATRGEVVAGNMPWGDEDFWGHWVEEPAEIHDGDPAWVAEYYGEGE